MKLGKAFSDSVESGQRPVSKTVDETRESWWLGMGRILMFATLFCIAFFVLLWRLFDLTVIQGKSFRLLSDENRIRELVRHAPRGILFDRTGEPLVSNDPYYRFIEPTGRTTLSMEEAEQLEKEGLAAGSFLEIDYHRRYLFPATVAHVLGYTGEVTQEELDDEYYKLRGYSPGDRIGRSGAEAVYEDRLRGQNGKELVEVDATGTIIRTLGRSKESPGEDITLAIDIGLQQVAADSFPAGAKGAIVVSKPDTGEILVLYSSPSYDMNKFSLGITSKEYEALQNNEDLPMFDRAIGGVYPPGSTFKLITSLAALEEKVIDEKTVVEDVGVLKIGPFSFPNWYFNQYGKTEGAVDIIKALKRSNDIFFYKTGEWLGITKLVSWSKKAGLGKPLGIELAGEASGLMPDPAWKKSHFDSEADRVARNDEWYLGDTYHVSIGQGYLLTTPLQVNAWTNIIANGGKLCRPTIRKDIRECEDMGLLKKTLDLITRGMQQACDTGGTGWPLFGFSVKEVKIPIACKTGTAEFGDPKNHTHAWFTAFGPMPDEFVPEEIKATESYISGKPEISVSVLVEGAGEGSSVAGPIAKNIFEEWFGR